MRKLSSYQKFDFNAFQQGKDFIIANSKYNESKDCITLDVAIVKDASNENLFEKFKVHCIQDKSEADLEKYPVGAKVQFKQVGKVAIYGEFNSNLSLEAIVEVIK